jgi:hypothetical protein
MEVLTGYWYKALCFLVVFGLSLIITTGQGELWRVEKKMRAINCPNLEIRTIAKLEWNHPIKLELGQAKPLPPDVAQFKGIPGPKYYPVRPHIRQTFASPGGIASLVYQGNQEQMPLALWVGETVRVIPLPEPPQAVNARSDGGMWVLNDRGLLFHYDRTGALKRTLEIPGRKIVGVEGDAIWVIDSMPDRAWFVSADADVRGPYSSEGLMNSMGAGTALCQLEGDNPRRRLQCLEPDGKRHFIPLLLPQNLYGSPLSFTDKKLLAVAAGGSPLIYYNTDGSTNELELENVGITKSGEAFVSVRIDENWSEVCTANGIARRIALKYENSSFLIGIPLKMTVVAVEGNRTLAFGYDRAVWYDGEHIESSIIVNDQRYTNEVFPNAWFSSIKFVTAKSNDGTVIISTTGPTGMALIGLRWHP